MGTCEELVDGLHRAQRPEELTAVRRRLGPGDTAIGVRMRDLFALAKQYSGMALEDVERLLPSPLYEVRMSAWCILDFRAKDPRTDPLERERLHRLYLDHHDRITTWDMVDRAAPSVVGGHLLGRDDVSVLHELATSTEPLRRRTAITAPLWFLRDGDDEDVARMFPLAARLAADPDPVVHKPVGIALKHAGPRAPEKVVAFLRAHGDAMPAPVRRDAAAKLDPAARARLS